MLKFRNVNYPYKTPDDTFVARGLHLNMLVDEINGTPAEVPDIVSGGTTDLILGLSTDIDAAFINYRAIFPLSLALGVQLDEVGKLMVNNSSQHANNAVLSHTRESGNYEAGSLINVEIDIVLVGLNIIMRVTNGSAYSMRFTYTSKIMSYAS